MYTTACPRNCYSTCTFKVHVEGGRIVRFEPHPGNRATPEGMCLKGLSYFERVYAEDRILHPMERTGDDGEFKRISWGRALEVISEHLVRIKALSGPKSVLYYTGSGTKGLLNEAGMNFWRLFGGCTTLYGDLCWPAGLEATRLTLGENKHNAPWDLANAELIVFWGKNPAETNIHQMVFVEKALERGARLVVIDPRRTQSAERAELLVQPRPGTDCALALAVARLLIANDDIDRDFIDANVHGFEAFERRVSEYTPEVAEEITDVPAKYVHRLADYFGSIKPATICAGYGMQRYTNSGQTMRSLIALLAITGNIGKPGAGWVYANLQSYIFDDPLPPVADFKPENPDGDVRVSISTARLGRDMLDMRDPPLKMAWVERGNPVSQNPETGTVLEAFRSLEFRVVVDQFLTDTAREADIVLPAKSMFEQTDVIGAYWHPYIQLKRKVIEPPGGVKPETEVYRLLAERLGFAKADIEQRLPGPTEAEVETFLEKKLEPFPEIDFQKLKEGPVLPPGHEEVVFADLEFKTPSGQIELASDEARQRWGLDPVPGFKEPMESVRRAGAYPLHFMTPNTKNRIHSQFNNLKMIAQFGEKAFVAMHPDDARKREIRDGAEVRIFNDRGELILPARIDFGLKAGCVYVTNGWWAGEGGAVNLTSSARETDMGYGAAFHDNLVEIEAVEHGE
jgi:anaerobic selenocysteine-containing dehydrogenase